MSVTEIIDVLTALIADAATLIADVHTGVVTTDEAEKRIAAGLARLATDRASEDAEIDARFPR
jgi:hypothetical protein